MSRWWWLILTVQVVSSPGLTQAESATSQTECGESNCRSEKVWSQSPETGSKDVLKRQPLLSGWGGQRLSDLLYFDSKRRPAFSSWGGKRGPAFSSWGGKRSTRSSEKNDSGESLIRSQLISPDELTLEVIDPYHIVPAEDSNTLEDDQTKRFDLYSYRYKKPSAAFSSWGGKRSKIEYILDSSFPDEASELKRYLVHSAPLKDFKFLDNYNGRSTVEMYPMIDALAQNQRYRRNSLSNLEEKRNAAFNSWGGKRASEMDIPDENKRAAAFNSWGGKRNAAFNSWGGKRAPELFIPDEDKRAAAFNSWGGKRDAAFNSRGGERHAAFNSWGGKRASGIGIPDEDKRTAAFNSWGGKREAELNSWRVKRSPEIVISDEDKRAAAFNSWAGKRNAAFNSWGGKRASEIDIPDEDKRAAAFNSWGGKRIPAFNSWGGKRVPVLDTLDEDKRAAAFNSWGGKRIPYDGNDRAATFSSWMEKRVPEIYYSDERKRAAAFNSWGGKRVPEIDPLDEHKRSTAAFNGWGGKRALEIDPLGENKRSTAAFNSWGGKRAAAFNSWGGKRDSEMYGSDGDKRAAAFNSWGGKRFPYDEVKRAAAFNSWGGKRVPALYRVNGKRAAAFNSWGGKRAAAFNSWDGKRAAAFNSWGGKRAAAFNSWGGKRAAAFNSWGGKRTASFNGEGGDKTAAFNSWDGKRGELRADIDPQSYNLVNIIADQDSKHNKTDSQQYSNENFFHLSELPQNSNDLENLSQTTDTNYFLDSNTNNSDSSSIREKRRRITIRTGKRKPRFYSWGGKKRSDSKINDDYDDDDFSNLIFNDGNGDVTEQLRNDKEFVNEIPEILEYTLQDENVAKRMNELISTHARSAFSGKRKPAFSSWGGKRSDYDNSEEKDDNESRRKRSVTDEDMVNGKWQRNENNDVFDDLSFPTSTLTCCVKKIQYGDKNLFMQMLYRTNGFRDFSWPTIRPIRRGAEFYSWGGKRTVL